MVLNGLIFLLNVYGEVFSTNNVSHAKIINVTLKNVQII